MWARRHCRARYSPLHAPATLGSSSPSSDTRTPNISGSLTFRRANKHVPRLRTVEDDVERGGEFAGVIGGELPDEARAHAEDGVLVEVVGFGVEYVRDQLLEAVGPHPHVGVAGTHPAPPVGPQELPDGPVERDRIGHGPDRAN